MDTPIIKEVLHKNNHPTEENPIIVDNYPYGGYRTRCSFWIETTKRGQRFCRQTLNPKTCKWNKPKKSIYSHILIPYYDERHHLHYISVSEYTSLNELHEIKLKYPDNMTDYQQITLHILIKMQEIYNKKFKVTIGK